MISLTKATILASRSETSFGSSFTAPSACFSDTGGTGSGGVSMMGASNEEASVVVWDIGRAALVASFDIRDHTLDDLVAGNLDDIDKLVGHTKAVPLDELLKSRPVVIAKTVFDGEALQIRVIHQRFAEAFARRAERYQNMLGEHG